MQRRTGSKHHAVIWAAFAVVVSLMAAFAGLAGPLPIGRDVIEVGGAPHPVLVLNPSVGVAPACGEVEGALKVVIPAFALVKSEPSIAGATVHVLDRGQVLPTFGQNDEGWWEVPLPGACNATGWVAPETFRTVRLFVTGDMDGQEAQLVAGGPSQTPAPTPTPTPAPTPTPTPAPAPTPTPVSGGITGSAGIVVSQSLRLRLGTVTGANGLVTVNDEGTGFTIAAETNVGSTFMVHLALCNSSGSALNGELQLTPAVSTAGAAKADDVTGLAQFGPSTWKFVMAAACNDFTPDIVLTIKIPDDLPPGFGGFTGVLRQVAA